MPDSIQPHKQNIKRTDSGSLTVYDMVGDQFTRNATYYKSDEDYKNNNPFMIKKIISYDDVAGTAEGVYQQVLKNKTLKDKKWFVVDFNGLTETVFTTMKSKTIEEVSKLNPKNFSAVEKSIYFLSGNLKSIESIVKDTPSRRQILIYHPDDQRHVPKDQVSNIKRRLASYSLYENGHCLHSSIFNIEGIVTQKSDADKKNPGHYLYKKYGYELIKEEHGYISSKEYTIQYLDNNRHLYQQDIMRDGRIAMRHKYDEKKQTILIESNQYKDEPGKLLQFKKNVFLPDKWDENGSIISGTMKAFENHTLVASGPFKQAEKGFITEGQHLYKKGEVCVFKDGDLLQRYKEEICELNGELIIKPHEQPNPIKLYFPKRKN